MYTITQRTVKAVLFDLDGTLVETKRIWFELINQTSIRYNYGELTYEDWEPTFGQSMEKNVEMFFPQSNIETITAYVESQYAKFIDKLEVGVGVGVDD